MASTSGHVSIHIDPQSDPSGDGREASAARESQSTTESKPKASKESMEELLRKYPKPKELEQDENDQNNEERSSWFDVLSFRYLEPLIRLGYHRPLVPDDVPALMSNQNALILAPQLEKLWREEVEKAKLRGKKPSFLYTVVRLTSSSIVTCLILQGMMRVTQVLEPLALQQLLLWLDPSKGGDTESDRGPLWEGVLWGLFLLLMTLMHSVVMNIFYHIGFRLLVQVRNACCSLVYAKALRVGGADSSLVSQDKGKDKGKSKDKSEQKDSQEDNSNGNGRNGSGGGEAKDNQKSPVGQIVNLMSVDAEKVGNMFFFSYSTFFVPLQIAVIIYLLYDTVGVAAFAGMGVLFIVLPSIAVAIMLAARVTRRRLGLVDERVKLTNEILQGIRIVKAYAWELFFQDRLNEARDREIDLLLKWNLYNGYNLFGFTVMTSLFAVCTFSVYSALGNTFRAATVFKALSFMNALQMPLLQLPNSFNHIINGLVSVERLEKFLLQPELPLCNRIDCRAPLLLHRKRYVAKVRRAELRHAPIPRVDAMVSADVRSLQLEELERSPLAQVAARRVPVEWIKKLKAKSEPRTFDRDAVLAPSEIELPQLPLTRSMSPETGDLISTSDLPYDPETGEPPEDPIESIDEKYALPELPESGWRELDADILNEAPPRVRLPLETPTTPSDPTLVVEIKDATFSWYADNSVPGWQPETHGSNGAQSGAKQYAVLGEDSAASGTLHVSPNEILSVRPTIENINFVLPRGKLVAVVGPVGSGKSTLISAILGELTPLKGSVSLAPDLSIAYVAQSPFVQTMTMRDNILFADATTFGGPGIKPPKDEAEEHPTARAARLQRMARYQAAIEAAALGPDIAALEAGDETEIGDRGINLSGGQKQRVAIARALYANADLYLFDDPLSALDAHVAEHVFESGLKKELANKTRLLVTNQLHFLQRCDYIYMLGFPENTPATNGASSSTTAVVAPAATSSSEPTSTVQAAGTVIAAGTYSDLIASNPHFITLMSQYEQGVRSAATRPEPLAIEEAKDTKGLIDLGSPTPNLTPSATAGAGVMAESNVEEGEDVALGIEADGLTEQERAQLDAAARAKAATESSLQADAADHEQLKIVKDRAIIGGGITRRGQQITEEETAVGGVPLRVFWFHFLTMGGLKMAIPMLLSAVAAQVALIALNFLLGRWADRKSNTVNDSYRTWYLMTLGIAVVLLIIRGFLYALGAVRSASYYHQRLAVKITRATPEFFDVTPVGRIISRFAKDLDVVDQQLPHTFMQTTTFTLGMIGSILTCAIILPWFTIAIVVVIVLFYLLQQYYSPSAIQMQRIESNSRSPVYQHFGETLKGLSTIRAFGMTPEFQLRCSLLLNLNSSALYNVRMIYRWGALRVSYLQCTLTAIVAALVIFAPSGVSPGMAGVALSYIIAVGGTIGFLVTQLVEFSGRINSVERLRYYLATIPQEPPLVLEPEKEVEAGLSPEIAYQDPAQPSNNVWPSQGCIRYDNVYMRYRQDLPTVLKGLTFEVKPGQKVGVVGRTGSGKSSLMMLLLRMYNPESGRILIDGVDISGVGLHRLRSRVGIVPQEPVLFSGTLRSNLDPFHQYSDAAIIDALEEVGLGGLLSTLPHGLNTEVAEHGSNFSQGQRQLICVARVLLKKPALLLLDEATSSVDSVTDSILRQVLSTRFGRATQLTIAHRLNTVADADHVLVLDQGVLAEEGSPKDLIEEGTRTGQGIFASMYQAYLKRNTSE